MEHQGDANKNIRFSKLMERRDENYPWRLPRDIKGPAGISGNNGLSYFVHLGGVLRWLKLPPPKKKSQNVLWSDVIKVRLFGPNSKRCV